MGSMKMVSSRGTSTSLNLSIAALVAAVVLMALGWGAVGCASGSGAQSGLIPSALDGKAIDVSATGTPATIPALSTGVPAGSIVQVDQWIAQPQGRQLHSQRWVDFDSHRARWDTYADPAQTNNGDPGTTAEDRPADSVHYSVVVDGDSSSSYDGDSGRVDAGPVDEAGLFRGSDIGWSAKTPVLIGDQLLAGEKVDVYRIDLHIPSGQERTADFGLIFVDSVTGLRVRDEWLLGSPGKAWVYHMFDYRLVARTGALAGRMTTDALRSEQEAVLAARLSAARSLGFPLWGLPVGTSGLVLSGVAVTTSARGSSVLLYYSLHGAEGRPDFSIETTDVRGRNDYPPAMLVAREEATVNSEGNVLDFGMAMDAQGHAQTAVRIQGWSESGVQADLPSLADLARSLVDLVSE